MELIEFTDLEGQHHFLNKEHIVAIKENSKQKRSTLNYTLGGFIFEADEEFFEMFKIIDFKEI